MATPRPLLSRLRRETRRGPAPEVVTVDRRGELLAGDPALGEVTADGRTWVGRRVSGLEDGRAAERNLGLVTAALEHAGVEYFMVPGRSVQRYVVGVRLTDRKALLGALRELYAGTALYAAEPVSDIWPATAALYAEGALPVELKRRPVIRFGEILLGPAGQVLAGLVRGCDVEFWRDGGPLVEQREEGDARAAEILGGLRFQAPPALLDGALVGPRPNAVSDVVPAEARTPATRTIGGTAHPTFADFTVPGIDEVTFPLDAVYTWVDGDDPVLAAKREAHRTGRAPDARSREAGASRYTSHDELKYSLRSLDMYAPFLRNIYIVTDGQTPSWLDITAPGIRVVDHKEIFRDPDALPVFNSHAIGTQLHHIDGLAEHYLYFNDDVFLGRPVTPGHFFHGNGIAKVPFSPSQLGLGAPHADEAAPNSAGKNVRRLLREDHGRMTVNKFAHTPHPQIRAVMREIEERYAADVDRTSRSRFRAPTDIAMGASFHHHQAFLTGRAVPGTYKTRYVDVARGDADERLAELLTNRRFDFFCLNDVNSPAEQQEEIHRKIHAFLEGYFPFPSRFERDA
ncbi:sugar phosphotransferase [Streptomyces sp. SID8379]|uniref:stealth family protein n=1 Tax=unclassified Streptomyces TaxID=2593676 RepID=UPI0004757645|nr:MULTISPECIES: stealth family protein [unclassified Streptomyces]MYW64206.1 sugar phosphotransferase [Streptomyces sp. SID8379]